MRNLARVTLVLLLAAVVVGPAASSGAAEAPKDPYHPHTLLVSFNTGTSAALREAVHGALGASVANRFEDMNLDVVWLPEGLDPVQARALYLRSSAVASASLNKQVRLLGAPNDLLFKDQWGFHNTGQLVTGSLVKGVTDADIDAPEGWGVAFPNGFESTGGTLVAVLDTGIDRAHADLLGKVAHCASATSAIGVVVEGSCTDDNLHGTHTAGTVAANTNNTAGVAGTAPNASLAIFKFLNAGGVGFLADEIAGLKWATSKNAKVFSMSYGSYESDGSEHQALKEAQNAGALLVAAAGNDYDDTVNFPAGYAEVMSVAATNAANKVSVFSNCNSDVEIAAPGEDIWSTFPENTYGVISGTSMATPHVAGAGALIMSEKGYSNSQARTQLSNSAVSGVNNGGRSDCNGLKLLNLANALGGGGSEPPPPGPGAIAGTVTESGKNKAPIASASVNCGSGGSATTGSDGKYTISNVPAGTYSCTASKTGYTSKTSNVTVTSGTTSTLDFALRKQ